MAFVFGVFGMIFGFVADHFLTVFMQLVVLEIYVVFVVIVLLCLERVGWLRQGERQIISVLKL